MWLQPKISFYPMIYNVIFTWFLGICYGFVLLSSAAGEKNDVNSVFLPGQSHLYSLEITVLMNEVENNSKSVGFSVYGNVLVENVWEKNNQKLLVLQLQNPELRVKSRNLPSEGYVKHTSELEKFENKPFILILENGRVQKILLPKEENTSLANLKKGVASTLQFQVSEQESTETDSSGTCTVSYKKLSSTKIIKSKTNCKSDEFPSHLNQHDFFGPKLESVRLTEYDLDDSKSTIKSISIKESHKLSVKSKDELGTLLEVSQTLNHLKNGECAIVNEKHIETVVENLSSKLGITYTEETLLTEKEETDDDKLIPNFVKEVGSFRNVLKTEFLGTLKPARAFCQLVNTAKKTNKDDITKALGLKKNIDILPQLYNILGYAQTKNAHDAVCKKLQFDNEEQTDLIERYLWAVSMVNQPNSEVISDLLNKYKKYVNIPEKIKETMILTLASAAKKLRETSSNIKVSNEVQETILNLLEYSKGEEKYQFFRALKNLQSPTTIPILLNYIKTGTLKEGLLSWTALRAFDKKFWTQEVLNSAKTVFFQLDKKHDTSSRTIAAEILLETNPCPAILEDILLHTVENNTSSFEVKRWVLQNIQMRAEHDEGFAKKVLSITQNNDPWKYNNYHWLSPRGMSINLKRNFYRNRASNGSLVTFQEIKSKVFKRGLVNLVMEKNGAESDVINIGIFSAGLSSLLSSDNSEDDQNAEEEYVTAGMELTILGTQIRPFVFFNGQGELMGHVWSGTASEKTPALQALFMIQDHHQFLRLGPGFVVEQVLDGAISFDVSGKIEISLWNRNAAGLVDNSGGILTIGLTKLDTSFVKSQVEFTASVESKLLLTIDSDFSSKVKLCLKLTQPDTIYRHNISKIERIPRSTHKDRTISKYIKYPLPGITYALNEKNTQMCNEIENEF